MNDSWYSLLCLSSTHLSYRMSYPLVIKYILDDQVLIALFLKKVHIMFYT